MNNKITKIIFPLSGGSCLQNYTYIYGDIIGIPYVTITIDKLYNAIETAHKQNKKLKITDSITLYDIGQYITISIKKRYKCSKDFDIFVPELYTIISHKWLLEQIKIIEKGAEYTHNCLLSNNRLVVFNTEDPYNNVIPTTLIEIFTKSIKDLIENKKDLTKLKTFNIWNYLTNFIIVDESTNKILASNKLKQLIADMRLRNMQNTTVYYVLHSIFKLTKDL